MVIGTNTGALINHTYSGGTTVNGGTLHLGGLFTNTSGQGISPLCTGTVGTGPVTLNSGTIEFDRVTEANALIVNGGTLYSQNGWGAVWSGPITLNATVTCSTAYGMTCSGAISGTGGLTKTGNDTLVLSATNSYSGPTSVNGGTLRCDVTDALGGGAVSISSGAKLNLNHAGTKIVASLTLGGVAQTIAGTYGSVASGAANQSDTYFVGAGTVTLIDKSDYAAWLNQFTFAAGANTTPTGDADGDGMTNQQEYAFGLDPSTSSSVNPIVQPLVNGTFKYTRRASPATTGLTYTVLTSADLVHWAADAGSAESVVTNGSVETVTFTVTTPAVNGKLFVRVEATSAP